jgi:membrane protein
LATPYVLLARRITAERLLLQGALTAVGMTVFAAGCAIYAPRAISTGAAEFGPIGVAFALLTLLWASGFVLVAAAAMGSYPYVCRDEAASGSGRPTGPDTR